MAITAWSAKVSSSAICLSVNGCTAVRRIRIAPIGTPSRRSGATRRVPPPTATEAVLTVGYSFSSSGTMSSMWIVRRSAMARP